MGCQESGSERGDLPIFASVAGTIRLDGTGKPACSRTDVEGVPGGFVLRDVLTPQECDQFVKFSETCGYTEDAPVSLGRHIRQNENCVWIADNELCNTIFERCKTCFPHEVHGGEVC